MRCAACRQLPGMALTIRLDINAGLIVDLPHLDDTGADGIGLFRTELQFLISALFPRFEAQRNLYGRVLDVAGERRVIFRTLDVGADKTLPYLRQRGEENPALGLARHTPGDGTSQSAEISGARAACGGGGT